MIVLSATNISKSYGVDVILKDISFHVNEGDRIGIVGANGAGKTTLLNILSGQLPYDEGNIFISSNTSIGYLKQSENFGLSNTVMEEVSAIFGHIVQLERDMADLSHEISEKSSKGEDVDKILHRYDEMMEAYKRHNGYSYKSEMIGILNSMAFTEAYYDKKIDTLSGGEKTRLALACLLLKKPDILFLDEPTNHLDIGTLKWLEQYLKTYSGTVILISHDRYFLDQTVNRIFEVENHKLVTYQGGYTTYAEQKRQRREEELRKYEQQQKEISRQEEIIRRFKQHGTEKLAKRAQSREKRLQQMDVLDKPEPVVGKMKIHFKQQFKSGNDVLLAEGLEKAFGYGPRRKELFKNVDFDIKRGERICIVGANGVGKTTLLKIMMRDLEADSGRLKIGHNVQFGYYDQEQQNLNAANTVFDEMKDSYRLYTDTEMRSLLGRFLFRNESAFLQVGTLSGGEKARLSLLKLMLSGSNVLILDEPTNHLDIASKEIFEDALLEFPGTVIIVSHDRYFLNKIPTRIFEMETDGITPYLGSYDYYMEKKQEIASGKKYLNELNLTQNSELVMQQSEEKMTELSASEQRRRSKEQEAKERRKEREQKRLEQEIERLELEISDFESKMCEEKVFSDHILLAEYHEENEKRKQLLEETYNNWLELQDQ
ncbi:ABC-F family ATP-binding cassette domain-containing protein [Clostridium aminobutyricum]|uniref:ABC-F family ATP-binding cassette domain-containing protein n=1 Tax=Clostridium aminobutyricum TaxID=33953 RepID=A0A939DAL8_CLOAM|nr:ABC-F family ATP-binding cassette domain-containing protein [Clostridium aminobutyricum]MBN7774301.1 ABC-F family ATP-binding cassette domain-containing protein [Clostridium aminobutyricum]